MTPPDTPRWLDAACQRRPGARFSRRMSGGRRVAAAFSPSDIAGLEAWYRETYAAGTWTDLSGNGRDLTQATGTARPTQVTRAGQLALQFSSASSQFVKGAFGATLSQPYTIYAVHEMPTLATTSIYSGSVSASGMLQILTTGYRSYAGAFLTGSVVPLTTIQGSCVVFNATTNNYVDNFVTAQKSGSAGAGGLDGISAGSQTGASNFFTGYIWEIIVYSGAHDAATRKQIGDYFTGRYSGLTVTT